MCTVQQMYDKMNYTLVAKNRKSLSLLCKRPTYTSSAQRPSTQLSAYKTHFNPLYDEDVLRGQVTQQIKQQKLKEVMNVSPRIKMGARLSPIRSS